MGREGEVVDRTAARVRARASRHPRRVQQLPWTAAHEKLLTAFAGDAMPDVCQLGNTWIPEFAALDALEPLDERVAASAVIDRATTSPGIWDTNVVDGAAVRRALVRRHAPAVLPPRPARARRLRRRRRATWARMDARARRGQARRRTAIAMRSCCRSTSSSRWSPSRLQQATRCCATADATAISAAPASGARCASTSTCFDSGFAPPLTKPRSRTSGTSSDAATSRSTSSGPWNIGEFKRRLPADRQDSWMTAPLPGPDGPGRVDRRRREPRRVPQLAQQGRGVAAGRIPVAARRAAAVLRAHRRPAAAAQRVGRRGAGDDVVRARVSRAARARAADAEGAGVGAHRDRDARRRPSASCTAICRSTRRPPSSTHAPIAILEKRRWLLRERGAEDARRSPWSGASRDRRARRWWFVAPALVVHRRVLLPAGAGRACAEPHRLRHLRARRPRQPALRRLAELRAAAARRRCSGRRSATRCTSSSSACRCRSPRRSARRCC